MGPLSVCGAEFCIKQECIASFMVLFVWMPNAQGLVCEVLTVDPKPCLFSPVRRLQGDMGAVLCKQPPGSCRKLAKRSPMGQAARRWVALIAALLASLSLLSSCV